MGFRYPKYLKDELIRRMLAGEEPRLVAASQGNRPSESTLKKWLEDYQFSQWYNYKQKGGTASFWEYTENLIHHSFDSSGSNASASDNACNHSDIPTVKQNTDIAHSLFHTDRINRLDESSDNHHDDPSPHIPASESPEHVVATEPPSAPNSIHCNDNINNWLDDLLGEERTCLSLDQIYCCRCGHVMDVNTDICSKCGVNQKDFFLHREVWKKAGFNEKYCYRCGRKIDAMAAVCPDCHAKQHATPATDEPCVNHSLKTELVHANSTPNGKTNSLIQKISPELFLRLLLSVFLSLTFVATINVYIQPQINVPPSPPTTISSTMQNETPKMVEPDLASKPSPSPQNNVQSHWKAMSANSCCVKSNTGIAMTVTGNSASELAVEIRMRTDSIHRQRQADVRFDTGASMAVDYSVPMNGMIKLSSNASFIRKMARSKQMTVAIPKQDGTRQTLDFSLMGFKKACSWAI